MGRTYITSTKKYFVGVGAWKRTKKENHLIKNNSKSNDHYLNQSWHKNDYLNLNMFTKGNGYTSNHLYSAILSLHAVYMNTLGGDGFGKEKLDFCDLWKSCPKTFGAYSWADFSSQISFVGFTNIAVFQNTKPRLIYLILLLLWWFQGPWFLMSNHCHITMKNSFWKICLTWERVQI